jgi:hypothetical protein
MTRQELGNPIPRDAEVLCKLRQGHSSRSSAKKKLNPTRPKERLGGDAIQEHLNVPRVPVKQSGTTTRKRTKSELEILADRSLGHTLAASQSLHRGLLRGEVGAQKSLHTLKVESRATTSAGKTSHFVFSVFLTVVGWLFVSGRFFLSSPSLSYFISC